MKITLESTSKIVHVNGCQCRIWTGKSESGVPVHAFIPSVWVPKGRPPEDYRQFEAELREHAAPSIELEAIPLRLII